MSTPARPSGLPVAIVTGGSRGIGRAVVERLCRDGHAVVFTHSSSDAEAARVESDVRAAGHQVWAERLDVTGDDAPGRLFDLAEARGRVTALVNNAGVTGPLGPLTGLPDADLRRIVDVNLTAPARLCREAARRWADGGGTDGGGTVRRAIVNVSSVAARTGSPHEYVVYAATKAAVETLTLGLARELGTAGILVNAVSPGTTDTTIHARAGEPGRARRVAASVPLRRPADPAEIAAAVSWLLSPDASYVTGTVLNVAGGL
ncbi:SDR family oxidoreductase [Actinomadura viridis]|uniref:NAD(P)-dependent dehydrogenase (Short-subunit alcohol dehydrogenase family) n=1 Tax=Actinomadura viridis TaxID=58110 RepID=A0A931GMU1_9ACTN|nr:SDR family oxidoreductase [Actinomadura viridis]MBG6093618.1 NAD(P)-dependent dehydrogenase (short-subunit alcohol dehydrogenase family) [Actinomadura viridis]